LKVLLLNQCFWPDLVATAQQLTGVARALAERGHEVTVLTGRRGYDDTALRFPKRQRWNGIEIIRLPSISLGKKGRWRRALNFASFSMAAALRLLLMPSRETVICLTSPPLISWLASLFTRLKGGRMIFWVMDLNPDEAIAAGWLREESMIAKLSARLLLSSMQHAAKIIVLDHFMKERIAAKGIPEHKIEVIAPSRDQSVNFDFEDREVFRTRHGLSEKFVVMYAGNHSPCHPLDTLLGAAERLKQQKDIAFVFAGGGSELSKVQEFARARQLDNILCLPYQPQAELAAMLSAAELQVVIMGEAFPGIIHPCKIYNILAVGAPFLYIGPQESHISELIAELPDRQRAHFARHGQIDQVVRSIGEQAEVFRVSRECVLRYATAFPDTLQLFINQIEVAQTLVCDSAPKTKGRADQAETSRA
jgi:glycosyltransferase involved in cell wall biosynthesis